MSAFASLSDDQPIAAEKPFGACIVVHRRAVSAVREFLILHRAHEGPDYGGDWAWTPPAGSRLPGEDIATCAARELKEETGLELELVEALFESSDFCVYVGEADFDCVIRLDADHDWFEWLSAETAMSRCRPGVVADEIAVALALLETRGDG